MVVNIGKQGCQNCIYRQKNKDFGLICRHKAEKEGITVQKSFYKSNEVKECEYYKYDFYSVIDR